MPVRTNYDKNTDILYVHVKSPVGISDFQAVITQIVNSKEHTSHVNTLWDFRHMAFVDFEPDILQKLVQIKNEAPERMDTKRALVISDDLGFGMTKMYESMARDLPDHIMIFRSFENAELWLLSDI